MTPRRTHPTPPSRPANRVGRLLRGIGALIVLVAVVVGVPMLMAKLNLVPRSIPSLHQVGTDLRRKDNGQLVAVVLAAGVWICWALFTASLLPELTATVRKKPAKTLPGLGAFQRPAGALVAAIAIAFTIAPLIAGVATAAGANATPTPPTPSTPTSTSTSVAGPTTRAAPTAPTQAPVGDHKDTASARSATASSSSLPKYEVQRRDTLWGISERYLHDPLRYIEIAPLNPGLVGPDNEITTGSVLTLPADATGPGLIHAAEAGRPAQDVTVDVEPGDELYRIEQRLTGDGDNWVEGFAANQGRVEPGGEHFTNPDLIKPGWTLAIPVPASSPQPAPTHQPPTHTDPPTHSHPQTDTPASPAPTHAPATPAAPTPATTEPAATPSHRAEPAAGQEPAARSSESTMLAFAGGGLLLAGVSLTALVYYRRRQFQRRNPGRTIGGSPPDLIRMERAVLAAGTVGIANVTWLDEALRSLVQSIAVQPGGRLPDVIAVRITETELTLVLTGAAPEAPAPWRTEADATRWTIQRSDPLPYAATRRDSYFAPFPTLASVGYTESGEHWMLDLERIAALSLSGDAERCLNLARFLAAELAHNTWSEMLQVTLVGFGQELVAANPDRLTYTEDLAAAAAAVACRLESVNTAMRAVDTDVLTGRLHDIVGDQWAPNVLLIAPHLAKDTAALDDLLAAMKRQHARTSVALVLADDPDRADATRWQLTVDREGTLSIPALDLELIAQQIPASEAAPLAQMLAWAAVCEDEPIPPAHGNEPWDKYADACGGLTVHADVPASGAEEEASTEQEPARVPGRQVADAAAVPVLHLAESAPWTTNSILPLSPQTYLERAATTLEDLQALAPVVDDRIRAEVEQADPDLDKDYADWFDQTCTRPKVRLLGRPQVWAQGALPERSPQLAFHTEAVALLTSRTNGLLSSEYAELMWPSDPDVVGKPKVRQSITNLRRWLGRDEETGEEYMPAWAFEGRAARYLIQKALRDAELFRRLRVRGTARGADGLEDYWRALKLVEGRPFDDIRIRREDDPGPGGWLWLTEANRRLDEEYQVMIVDTAHIVADRHLGAGEPELAAKAAQVALRAGSYSHVPLLDLVAACLEQEKDTEAESHVRQLMMNAGVEREEDLDPRTYEVLVRLRRRWRPRAS
jgi:nucleoid-associated protein YgaU